MFCWQASELRCYLKAKGAEISEENSELGLHVDLAQIIEACDVCLKDDDKGDEREIKPSSPVGDACNNPHRNAPEQRLLSPCSRPHPYFLSFTISTRSLPLCGIHSNFDPCWELVPDVGRPASPRLVCVCVWEHVDDRLKCKAPWVRYISAL